MPEINYVHPQINQIKNQEISIQVSLSGFSFSIRPATEKKCLLFRHYKFSNILLIDELMRKTQQILSDDSKLHSAFTKAEVTLISQNSAIIPAGYFKPENLKKLFEFSHNLGEFDELHYTFLPETEAYNVFSLPGYFSQMFSSAFKNVHFGQQASKLVKLGHQHSTAEQPVIVLGLNSGFFDMIVFDNHRLQLANSYQYTNTTDFVYFFLYACRQLKIETEQAKVLLYGQAIDNQALVEELAAHINQAIIPDIETDCGSLGVTPKQVSQFYSLFLNT
ncbi:MAG: DUF3822 family protein [Bacteroidales bacterium]|nr:DUF3822 family protein [Bacteroidales bacterium]